MAFVDSSGWQIWYDVRGSGQPLILCGGPIMLHDQFGRAPDLLAEYFQVVNWNWRGVGNSSRSWMAGLKFDDWIDDLVRVMDAAGIEKADFWGVSWGSLFAIRLAARHPERVGRLVLHPVMTGPTAEAAELKANIVRMQGIEQLVWSGFWQAGSAESFHDGTIVRTALHEIEVAKRHMPGGILPRAHALYTELDLTPEVAGLDGPILLLLGASGKLGAQAPSVSAVIERFRSACPQTEVVTVPGTGGTMAAIEAPDVCAAAVRAFLTAEEPASRLHREDAKLSLLP